MSDDRLNWASAGHPGGWVVAPAGRVDESTATAFADGLVDALATAAGAGAARLVVDLAGIAYMSSRGLRGLTLASRKAGDHAVAIVLAAPGETMREILAISRYDKVFNVFDSVEAALAG